MFTGLSGHVQYMQAETPLYDTDLLLGGCQGATAALEVHYWYLILFYFFISEPSRLVQEFAKISDNPFNSVVSKLPPVAAVINVFYHYFTVYI